MGAKRSTIVKLSERELELLRIIEMSPKMSVVEIAKCLSKKVHRVRYDIQQLEDRNILQRTVAVVNPNIIGLSEFFMYFSLNSPSISRRQRFLNACKEIQGLSWLTPCGGSYEYFSSFCLQDLMALSKIVGILSDNHGAIFGNKIVAQLTQFVYYGRKYLYPSRKLPAFTYSADVKRRKVSDSERSILSSIQRNEDASFRQLATLSNTSLSTVARALEQLEHDGVLVSYTRRINVASLGVQSYKLVVHAADLGDSFFRRIEEFCAQHLSVVSLARCVGPWDFDIRIELSATENPAMVVQEFQEAFDDGILSCMLSPLYQPIVMNNFPYTA